MESIYTHIHKKTVENARQRLFEEIDILTNGQTDKLIELLEEYNELSEILEMFKKKRI